MRRLLPAALASALVGAAKTGCGNERQSYVTNICDGTITPTLTDR